MRLPVVLVEQVAVAVVLVVLAEHQALFLVAQLFLPQVVLVVQPILVATVVLVQHQLAVRVATAQTVLVLLEV